MFLENDYLAVIFLTHHETLFWSCIRHLLKGPDQTVIGLSALMREVCHTNGVVEIRSDSKLIMNPSLSITRCLVYKRA